MRHSGKELVFHNELLNGTKLVKSAYFISDAHLGTTIVQCGSREQHLIQFLQHIQSTTSHLYIVGDLFDFWIEYRHAIRPIYFPILHELKKLVDLGIHIHYLAGNHDFALGSFLEEHIGIHIHPDHLVCNIQDRKIRLYHGDGILKNDSGYRFWRKTLRNPINQMIYKLLHPNIGVPLASLCSLSSRRVIKKKFSLEKRTAYFNAAYSYLQSDTDIMIMGHTHHPELYNIQGRIYCNTGEWLYRYCYAKLTKGILSLWRFIPDHEPVEFKPSFEKPGKRVS